MANRMMKLSLPVRKEQPFKLISDSYSCFHCQENVPNQHFLKFLILLLHDQIKVTLYYETILT